jgi:CheY-like chemotaxis protein
MWPRGAPSVVSEALETRGYTTLEAEDGASDLSILDSNARIDLLIADVGLPGGLNGRQVADAARAQPSGLKVVFITGYADNAVVGGGRLEPGMQIMTNPFDMSTLATRVRSMLAQ